MKQPRFTAQHQQNHIYINMTLSLIINGHLIIINLHQFHFMLTIHRQRLNTDDTSTTTTTHSIQQLRRCNNAHACGTKLQGRSPHRILNG